MYAQGLQMGEALRNTVLDPANPKACDHMNAAREAFGAAYAETMLSAKGTSLEQPLAQTGRLA